MNLQSIRQKIDQIDTKIIRLVGQRQDLIAEIGKLKKLEKLPVCDAVREAEMLSLRIKLGKKHNLSAQEIKKIFTPILKISKSRQLKIAD